MIFKNNFFEEKSYFSWPLDKLITFTAAMNLIKNKKKNKIEPKIIRYAVHKNIIKNKKRFSEYFNKYEMERKQTYLYMDELIKDGYFVTCKEMETGSGTIRELTSTSKAERLYEHLWFSINLKSKEDIEQIVLEAIENERLSEQEKEKIVQNVFKKLDEKRIVNFPFLISKELAKKAFEKRE